MDTPFKYILFFSSTFNTFNEYISRKYKNMNKKDEKALEALLTLAFIDVRLSLTNEEKYKLFKNKPFNFSEKELKEMKYYDF